MTSGELAGAVAAGRVSWRQHAWVRRLPTILIALPVGFVMIWVLFLASDTGSAALVKEPGEFLVTLLNGFTLAGLLFVVASGFTLIFGLMRAVNMAHGSLFLLAAYIAIDLQQEFVGKTRNIDSDEVGLLVDWVLPLLIASAVVAVIGLVMQQLFLQWNQGQELRQALITVGISVIIADQMIEHFGGLAQSMVWPGAVTKFFTIFGERYAVSRLFMLGVALLVGLFLWLWLNKTRMGMVIRAGVDDQEMVRALGLNITLVFAITFFVGSFLAGMGGVMGASFSGANIGVDGEWLIRSLVVVIVGGLGSLKGAVAGSLLYGMVLAFSPAYLPSDIFFYSIIFTFVLLALVLAVRPNGLFGRAG